jgi:hypothetical protein
MAAGAAVLVIGTAMGFNNVDFGAKAQHDLEHRTRQLFGFKKPLSEYTGPSVDEYPSSKAIAVAKGLEASVVTEDTGRMGDMIAFWPDASNPTHIIACIEDRDFVGTFPSVQRVELATGDVETILTGMDACDGIRTTAWGTILATEEEDSGNALEIWNPLTTTGEWYNRVTGVVYTDDSQSVVSTNIIERPALGTFAWEGIGILPDGTVYAGDELRPGDSDADANSVRDDDGGAIFKFIPDNPWDGLAIVDTFAKSPFAAGDLYFLQIGRASGGSFRGGGQGMETGDARWAGPIDPDTARVSSQLGDHIDGVTKLGSATGHYRPEDLHIDPETIGEDVIRLCWTNTGNSENHDWSNVKCATDDTTVAPMMAGAAVVQYFVMGDEELNSSDNLDFQPVTGNTYIIEDTEFGDVWACLPDGADRDIMSDGCVRVATVLDADAEPTGFIFFADGTKALMFIQHRNDPTSPYNPGQDPPDPSTDPLILIEGFKVH